MKYAIPAVLVLLLAGCVATADAGIVRIGSGDFTPQASVITFSEPGHGLLEQNPVYTLTTVSLGTVTVSFNANFVGQAVVDAPSPPAQPGVRTISGTPTGPLTLTGSGVNYTFIVTDGSNPTSPVLSGTPMFNGPVSVLFSTPVAAVGLDGGFFNAVASTSIEAFDATGTSLGSVQNTQTGIEFFGLADSSGDNVISGISFYITGNETAGFAIDNLTFGSRAEFVPLSIPEPASLIVWSVLAGIVLGLGWRHRAH